MIPISFVAPPISERQKNIVNPDPGRFATNERWGEGYSYDQPRNKFVQQAIHHMYVNYSMFPSIGAELTVIGPVSEDLKTITLSDARAYAAAYPQNAYVSLDPTQPEDPFEIRKTSNHTAWSELEIIAMMPTVSSLLTITTEESQKPEFQTGLTDPSVPPGPTAVAQLPSFNIPLPSPRIRDIETSLRSVMGSSNVSPIQGTEEIEDTLLFKQPSGIDFSDWTQNVTAEKPAVVNYNNHTDEHFYYVERLSEKNPSAYDIGTAAGYSALEAFKTKAIAEIAKFAHKDDTRISAEDINKVVVESTYGPPDRPNPPPNSTTWRLAGRVPNKTVQDLVSNSSAGKNIPHASTAFRVFAEKAEITRKTSVQMGTFKGTLKRTEKALSRYAEILSEDGITSSMLGGLNIEQESIKVSSFFSVFDNFLAANNIDPKPADLVELSFTEDFRLRCIIYNGDIKLKGLGISLYEADEITSVIYSPSESTLNDVGPTTFGYIFYSRDIIDAVENQKDPMPWSEFVPRFTFPNPCVKPTEIQNKIAENRKKKKESSLTEKLFNSESDIQKSALARLGITEKDIYNSVTSALGECDGAQAALFKDALLVYNTVYGKTSPKRLAIRAATVLRDELLGRQLVSKEFAADAEQAAIYAARPDVLLREVETEVNQMLYCLFGALGEAVMDQILKPMGASPTVRNLVRDMSRPPKPPLKLKKGHTTDFFKAWRKQVQKLLIQFIKQLILSIFKDILKAALGCPEPEADDESSTKKLRSSYGVIQINDLVDRKGDIDLTRLATENGIFDRRRSKEGEANSPIITYPPSKEKIRQFNKDTSDILMSRETVELLDGQAGERTQAIIEAVVYGTIEDKETATLERLAREDSLAAQDPRYATLTIDKGSIAGYFAALGLLLGRWPHEMLEDLSVSDEYCDDEYYRPISDFGGVSNAQAQSQIQQQIDAILTKTDQLCGILSFDFNFGLDMKKFEGLLEPPQFYTDMLRAIADASNAARDAIARALAYPIEQPSLAPSSPPPYTQTELWQKLIADPNYRDAEYLRPRADKDNKSGYFKEMTYRLGGMGQHQEYIELSWDARGAQVEIGKTGTLSDRKVKESEKVIAKSRAAESNAPSLEDDYTIKRFYPLNFSSMNTPFAARQLNREWTTGRAAVQNRLRQLQHSLTTLAYGPNVGNWDSTNRTAAIASGLGEDDWDFIGILANNSEHINYNVRGVYLLQDHPEEEHRATAKKRLNKFIKTIVQAPFQPNGDPCYETEEEFRARAMAESIQSYLINFFLNIVPLFRVYSGWQTPDTLNLMAAYVFSTIKTESLKDGVFPLYLKEMETFTDVYSKEGEEARGFTDINLKKIDDPQKQLEYYIRQCISEMLKKVGTPEMFGDLTTSNFFETPWLRSRYQKLSDFFKRGILATGDLGTLALAQERQTLESEISRLERAIDADEDADTLNDLGIARLEANRELLPLKQARLEEVRQLLEGQEMATVFIDNSQNSLNSLPGTFISQTTNATFAKRDFLTFVPLPYILASYAIYFDRIVNVNSKTINSKFYSYRRIAAANDAFINAVIPNQLGQSLKYFNPFPALVAGIEYFTFDEMRADKKYIDGMMDKLGAVESAREVIAANLDKAKEALEKAEDSDHADQTLDSIRWRFSKQEEVLARYTIPGGVTHFGALFQANGIDKGPWWAIEFPAVYMATDTDNPGYWFHSLLTAQSDEQEFPWGDPLGQDQDLKTPFSKQNSTVRPNSTVPGYWLGIEHIQEGYYLSAYGSAWIDALSIILPGINLLDDEAAPTRAEIANVRNALVDNIRGGLNHDQITDTDRSMTWGTYFDLHPGLSRIPGDEVSTPFADLRRALYAFSVPYITEGRNIDTIDNFNLATRKDRNTLPDRVARRKDVLDRLNLGNIYNSDGVLTIGQLNGLSTALGAFLSANDLGNWEDT
jgi:hypothetical protein